MSIHTVRYHKENVTEPAVQRDWDSYQVNKANAKSDVVSLVGQLCSFNLLLQSKILQEAFLIASDN